MREKFADRQAGLAVLLEFERRRQHFVAPIPQVAGEFHRNFFTMIFLQDRLGVETVHVRNPATHEQPDDPLGPRGKLGEHAGARVAERFFVQQSAQRDHAKSGAGPA